MADGHAGDEGKADQPHMAHLHAACDLLRRRGDKLPAPAFKRHIIVGHQRPSPVDQAQCKVGLAAAGCAHQQYRAPIQRNAIRMDCLFVHNSTVGRVMVKRAPEVASARSSAAIRPSGASTVALAMARPRPECLPNASTSGRTMWNRRNIASRASGGMPGSSSSNPSCPLYPSPGAQLTTTTPFWTNLYHLFV